MKVDLKQPLQVRHCHSCRHLVSSLRSSPTQVMFVNKELYKDDNGRKTMERSSSSDSIAPNEFPLVSSDEFFWKLTPTTYDKCHLCQNARTLFYCSDCILNWAGYQTKKKQLTELGLKLTRLEASLADAARRWTEAERLKHQIRTCREKLRILKEMKEAVEVEKCKGHEKFQELRQKNQRIRKRLPQCSEKVMNAEHKLASKQETCQTSSEKLATTRDKVRAIVRSNVHQLSKYIFPITQTLTQFKEDSISDDKGSENAVSSALAEASRTTYVCGRWVLTESTGEAQYQIVQAILPSLPDLESLKNWDKETGPPSQILTALAYTAQLVDILAFYLDVRLPKRMNFSEFYNRDLTEAQFLRKIARLNDNITYLCATQRVPLEHVNSSSLLHRLLALLNSGLTDLGRQGPFEMYPRFDILSSGDENQENREYSSESEEESDSINADWEAISSVAGGECSPNRTGSSNVTTISVAASPPRPSIQTSLMSTAAASISSLWRGWKGSK